jgi:hypothetical protein
MKIFVFLAFFIFSSVGYACDGENSRREMVAQLFSDHDMRNFVCGEDDCTSEKFYSGVVFNKIVAIYRGKKLKICLVTPEFSAVNSFTGIFAGSEERLLFQFISFGAGIKIEKNKDGTPIILEYGFNDSSEEPQSVVTYKWNGKYFVFANEISKSR